MAKLKLKNEKPEEEDGDEAAAPAPAIIVSSQASKHLKQRYTLKNKMNTN